MSFRDISKIIKRYNKKLRAQQNKKEGSQTKKLSLRSQFFKSVLGGNKIINVAL